MRDQSLPGERKGFILRRSKQQPRFQKQRTRFSFPGAWGEKSRILWFGEKLGLFSQQMAGAGFTCLVCVVLERRTCQILELLVVQKGTCTGGISPSTFYG